MSTQPYPAEAKSNSSSDYLTVHQIAERTGEPVDKVWLACIQYRDFLKKTNKGTASFPRYSYSLDTLLRVFPGLNGGGHGEINNIPDQYRQAVGNTIYLFPEDISEITGHQLTSARARCHLNRHMLRWLKLGYSDDGKPGRDRSAYALDEGLLEIFPDLVKFLKIEYGGEQNPQQEIKIQIEKKIKKAYTKPSIRNTLRLGSYLTEKQIAYITCSPIEDVRQTCFSSIKVLGKINKGTDRNPLYAYSVQSLISVFPGIKARYLAQEHLFREDLDALVGMALKEYTRPPKEKEYHEALKEEPKAPSKKLLKKPAEELPKPEKPDPEIKPEIIYEQRPQKQKRILGRALSSLDKRVADELKRTKEEALKGRGTAYPSLEAAHSVLGMNYGIAISKEGFEGVAIDYDLFVQTAKGQKLMDTTLDIALRMGIFDRYDQYGNPIKGYNKKPSLEMQADEKPAPKAAAQRNIKRREHSINAKPFFEEDRTPLTDIKQVHAEKSPSHLDVTPA